MKKSTKTGVIAALLDEYQYAINDLINCIRDIADEQLLVIADPETKNKDCVSIQSVLTHIVFCGKNYITMIDIDKGNTESIWPRRVKFDTVKEYISVLKALNDYTVSFLDKLNNREMAQFDPSKKIKTSWGQLYDYEQLMEHAIVHVYRHRRQIQSFKKLSQIKNSK